MRRRFPFRRLVRSESGAELIEFGLTLPLLLLVVLGIMEFGMMLREYEVITNAAREGARIAILPGYEDEDVEARVEAYLATANVDCDDCVTVEDPVPTAVGAVCVSMVPVTVVYPHSVLFLSGIMSYFGSGFGVDGNIDLSATSSMRTEVSAGSC